MFHTGLNPACIEVYLGFPERHRVAASGKATCTFNNVGQYKQEGTVDRALSNKPIIVPNSAELKECTVSYSWLRHPAILLPRFTSWPFPVRSPHVRSCRKAGFHADPTAPFVPLSIEQRRQDLWYSEW
ncbi:hypothetical protein K466DRAFT_571102 [Polyporus arcularius HHB13444]|uniref:Uncharacterized protein n=1 Tax=Polyporus arcularius HHB13444 TaxID=1314778 RepID=A0A5C3NKL7_9APHY|nr:hypothetical protein K466DRAFT_571102 [Polyporus arcularius HHB13444]